MVAKQHVLVMRNSKASKLALSVEQACSAYEDSCYEHYITRWPSLPSMFLGQSCSYKCDYREASSNQVESPGAMVSMAGCDTQPPPVEQTLGWVHGGHIIRLHVPSPDIDFRRSK